MKNVSSLAGGVQFLLLTNICETAKTMVISLQEQALAGMMRDERWNLQNGGLEDLPEFLIARGVHQCVAASQKDLLQLPRQWHRGPLPPAPEEEVPAL